MLTPLSDIVEKIMNDKAKEADLRMYDQMKQIMTMIEERYGMGKPKIGEKVRVITTDPVDGSIESFTGTVRAINDFSGAYQVSGEFYNPRLVIKMES